MGLELSCALTKNTTRQRDLDDEFGVRELSYIGSDQYTWPQPGSIYNTIQRNGYSNEATTQLASAVEYTDCISSEG